MTRVQIQLPEPLAEQLKNIASVRDISFAELCRKGLERYAAQLAQEPQKEEVWVFPILPANKMNEDEALYRQEAEAIEKRNI
jgi:hypothetical protein